MTMEEKSTKAKRVTCPVCLGPAMRDKDWHPQAGLDPRLASFVCQKGPCGTRFFILLRRNQY